jgi:hypothetical protein
VTTLTRIIGVIVLILGIAGLLQVMGMNTDMFLTGTRIILGVLLLAASGMGERAERIALALFGIVYIGNFLSAFVSPRMFGLLPHVYGVMDNTVHLVGGIIGLFLALRPADATCSINSFHMKKYDAMVIGSGLSGLSCGYYLSKKGKIRERSPIKPKLHLSCLCMSCRLSRPAH